MSISDSLDQAIVEARLIELTLEFDSDPVERRLFLCAELHEELRDGVAQFGSRIGRLQADLEHFVQGGRIDMSLTPYQHGSAYMGLLDPVAEGGAAPLKWST